MNMKTETTTTTTFADRAEANAYICQSLQLPGAIRVWFSDHYWNEADRYEVIVVTMPPQIQ